MSWNIMPTMGIDVDSKTLNCCILKSDKKTDADWLEVKNNPQGFQMIMARIRDEKIKMVYMEATGGYEKEIFQHISSSGVAVVIENPSKVRRFAQGIGFKCKNDKTDAFVMARMAQVNEVPQKVAVSPAQLKVKELVRRRYQLCKMITQEKNHLHLADGVIKKTIDSHIKSLEKLKILINEEIQKVIDSDNVLAQMLAFLKSFKGVGDVTAATIIGILPEIGKINNKKIARLAGVAPMDNDSGERKGKRFISGGRPDVRKALYMAALVAIRHEPHFKLTYEKFVARGKCKKVAIVAIMRKMLVRINASFRKSFIPHETLTIGTNAL